MKDYPWENNIENSSADIRVNISVKNEDQKCVIKPQSMVKTLLLNFGSIISGDFSSAPPGSQSKSFIPQSGCAVSVL